jgi:hypothetical protein
MLKLDWVISNCYFLIIVNTLPVINKTYMCTLYHDNFEPPTQLFWWGGMVEPNERQIRIAWLKIHTWLLHSRLPKTTIKGRKMQICKGDRNDFCRLSTDIGFLCPEPDHFFSRSYFSLNRGIMAVIITPLSRTLCSTLFNKNVENVQKTRISELNFWL